MENQLNDDQLNVWEILANPYIPPMEGWDDMRIEDLRRIVDEVKKEMIKQNALR